MKTADEIMKAIQEATTLQSIGIALYDVVDTMEVVTQLEVLDMSKHVPVLQAILEELRDQQDKISGELETTLKTLCGEGE